MAGPATSILFKPINITIGTWKLNQNNFIGVFLGIIFALYATIVFFCVSNVSQLNNAAIEDNNSENDKNMDDYEDTNGHYRSNAESG